MSNLVTRGKTPASQTENINKGAALTHDQLDDNFYPLYITTDGTAEANKALIVDASKNIGTLGTVTATDVVVNETVTFDAEGAATHSSATLTIDWLTGNKQEETLTTTDITTVTFSNDPAGPCNLLLKLTQDSATPVTCTGWPASVKWAGGTEPVLSGGVDDIDIITFYYDGTNYFGAIMKDFA